MGLFSKNILFFPGCAMRSKMPEHVKNWRAILDDLDINYIEIPEMQCCGAPAREAGYHADFNGMMSQNRKILRDYKVREIMSPCPSCVLTFGEIYGLNARHTAEVLFEKRARIGKNEPLEGAYHDPCTLARKLKITSEPREVLAKAGCRVLEFPKRGVESVCCGGCGTFPLNSPAIAAELAKRKVRESPSERIITADPHCYLHLKEHADGKHVMELSEVFVR